MKVREIMSSPVQYCTPETNLAAAAGKMWDSDCGIMPVIDPEGKVTSVLTDRDICIAVATSGRLASAMSVWEASSPEAVTCGPDDDIRDALHNMAARRVRRLPVVAEDGTLLGMLSLNDIILEARERNDYRGLTYDDVMQALKAISGHRVPSAA
jgi:CBS domain-containing protein